VSLVLFFIFPCGVRDMLSSGKVRPLADTLHIRCLIRHLFGYLISVIIVIILLVVILVLCLIPYFTGSDVPGRFSTFTTTRVLISVAVTTVVRQLFLCWLGDWLIEDVVDIFMGHAI
jgi:hypothetical protein